MICLLCWWRRKSRNLASIWWLFLRLMRCSWAERWRWRWLIFYSICGLISFQFRTRCRWLKEWWTRCRRWEKVHRLCMIQQVYTRLSSSIFFQLCWSFPAWDQKHWIKLPLLYIPPAFLHNCIYNHSNAWLFFFQFFWKYERWSSRLRWERSRCLLIWTDW